jgi:hypothetical protein
MNTTLHAVVEGQSLTRRQILQCGLAVLSLSRLLTHAALFRDLMPSVLTIHVWTTRLRLS